jgi:ABC-2 type transport system ATP-binding protein
MTAPQDAGGDTPMLEFANVAKWYGPIAALLDVSVRVGREVVGLVGKNGVGKSTLMKLAVGLLAPSQGEVRVAGHRAGSRAARALTGFSPDGDRLYEDLTGAIFVTWMLRYHGFSRGDARARSDEVLTQLGMAEHMHRPIHEYSKGMRQRVRLAQALAHRPSFVLLDEPMTGLDPVGRSELAAWIRELPSQGVGVLVSSHVLHELEAIADRVVLLHQGRLLAEGRVAELREQLPARPHRVRIRAPRLRELAATLAGWPQVLGLRFTDDALEVALAGEPAFYDDLTRLGADWTGGLQEVLPLDDDLAAVFGYLVG